MAIILPLLDEFSSPVTIPKMVVVSATSSVNLSLVPVTDVAVICECFIVGIPFCYFMLIYNTLSQTSESFVYVVYSHPE